MSRAWGHGGTGRSLPRCGCWSAGHEKAVTAIDAPPARPGHAGEFTAAHPEWYALAVAGRGVAVLGRDVPLLLAADRLRDAARGHPPDVTGTPRTPC
ncbi:hypothetical protein [Streptomyces sp. x-19]|uniref:hypothetical protein n=1 Tax=Streptomyces sp. x-19 TaxID=2789280 RepID=UPI0039808564